MTEPQLVTISIAITTSPTGFYSTSQTQKVTVEFKYCSTESIYLHRIPFPLEPEVF